MKRALILAGGGARGSFQIGVWKYLVSIGWKPDMICGTSVGAINAVAIGSGMDLSTLIHLWTSYNRRRMYHFNFLRFIADILSGKAVKPLFDTTPLKNMILSNLDFTALKKSETEIIITAVNMLTGHPEFFDQKVIRLEHILASSAMPLLFPWQEINGEPYWDGGVMVNTPLAPALEFGADEIIVVLLSPVGHKKLSKPENLLMAGEYLFEHFLSGSFQTDLMNYGFNGKRYLKHSEPLNNNLNIKHKIQPRLITLSPSKMLGFKSLLSFSKTQARKLIDEGYLSARSQLDRWL